MDKETHESLNAFETVVCIIAFAPLALLYAYGIFFSFNVVVMVGEWVYRAITQQDPYNPAYRFLLHAIFLWLAASYTGSFAQGKLSSSKDAAWLVLLVVGFAVLAILSIQSFNAEQIKYTTQWNYPGTP